MEHTLVHELKKYLLEVGADAGVMDPEMIQATTMARFNHSYEMTWKSDVQFMRNMKLFLKYLKSHGLRVNYDYMIKIDNEFLEGKIILLLRRGLSDKRVEDITSKTQFHLVQKEVPAEQPADDTEG